jgi:hypothetical protein
MKVPPNKKKGYVGSGNILLGLMGNWILASYIVWMLEGYINPLDFLQGILYECY